ncbi:MAG: hypothetical protein RSA79_07850, partial [Oscillospiraceae bacterium]
MAKPNKNVAKPTVTPTKAPKLTEFERDKQAKHYAIEAAKSRQISNGNFDDTFAQEQPIVPTTFKQKFCNVWYHYRLHILIVLVLVVSACIVCSTAFRSKRIDASLTVVSNQSLVGSNDLFYEALKPLILNQEKKPKINLSIIQIPHDAEQQALVNPQQAQMNRAKLMGTLTSKDSCLYMLDQDNYNDIIETGLSFLNLEEFVGKENKHVKGDKYYIEDTAFAEQLQLDSTTTKGMFLCIVQR